MSENERTKVPNFNDIFRLAEDVEESEIQKQIRITREKLAAFDAVDGERSASVVPLSEDGDDWQQPAPEPLQVGDWVSFYGSITLSVGTSEADSFKSILTRFGADYEITPELLEHNDSLWALIDDPEAQERRWKRTGPLVARGRWPEKVPRWERGSYEQDQARDTARAEAFKIADENERRKALRRVDDLYGLKSTSYNLGSYDGGLR
jgi:hypothetical protein